MNQPNIMFTATLYISVVLYKIEVSALTLPGEKIKKNILIDEYMLFLPITIFPLTRKVTPQFKLSKISRCNRGRYMMDGQISRRFKSV